MAITDYALPEGKSQEKSGLTSRPKCANLFAN
jgi:hypothetical protein